MKTTFQKLIRFQDHEGNIRYGEAPEDLDNLKDEKVPIYEGAEPWDLKPSSATAKIAKVRLPC